MMTWSRSLAALGGASLMALATFAGADAADKKVSVAAISGYFAQGFGVSIVNGLNKAKDDFGINLKLIDTGNRALDYQEQFDNVAKSGEYDIVFVMGWELADALQKTAEAYPNQRFIFIDGVLDSKKVIYANFAEEQGSYVTGTMAAAIAAKPGSLPGIGDGKQVGFVGGRDIPVIRNFLHGYEEGAKAAAPDVKVNSVFAGTFDDPAKGAELTLALYDQGADIVYNVAGPTGEGVMQASAQAGKYSIGVDIDMCDKAPGHVLGSMLKRGDVAVYSLIKDEVEGRKLEPGSVHTFDLKSGGVELKLCSDVAIPQDVKDKIEQARKDVADGKVTIKSVK